MTVESVRKECRERNDNISSRPANAAKTLMMGIGSRVSFEIRYWWYSEKVALICYYKVGNRREELVEMEFNERWRGTTVQD